MPFEKDNPHTAKKLIDRDLDKQPISFKGYLGHREEIRQVPHWQQLLRDYVEKLIKDQQESTDISKNS